MAVAPDPSHGAVSRHRRRRLDVRVVPHRRRSAFRLRDWRMRTKLGAVLVVPSIAFLVLAGAQTGALVSQAGLLGEFADQVGVGREITTLIHELQRERDQTAGELAALGSAPGGQLEPGQALPALEPVYPVADRAINQFRVAAEPLARGEASWRISYDRVDEALKRLPDVRAAVPAAGLTPDPVLSEYDRVIEVLLVLLAEPSPGSDRPDLTDAVLRYVEFAQVKEVNSKMRGHLYAAARAGRYEPTDLVALTDLRAQQLTGLADFRLSATDRQIERYASAASNPNFLAAVKMEETTFTSGDRIAAVLEPKTWWTTSQQRQDLLRQVEAGAVGDAVTLAENRSAEQLRRTVLTAGGVLAVLVAALFTSIAIGRSVASSLRMLRSQALRVAQVELPETLERLRTVDPVASEFDVPPADVRSMDEIGEVAEAFVAVHRSAVTVALEQAVMRRHVNAMFVNLARRSQVLVERQLELLDELEQDEGDPDQLENLFKLDHLAARMRRNDDSLLVLAGTEATRRWNRPVLLPTVMLAAVAEIEQYQRIRHNVADELYIVGHAVADLVHLLAELLENASSFSRPDTVVRIDAAGQPDGSVLVEIVDQGLGMSPSALEQANEVLAVPPAADVSASERMGLFVVSHLAARQGVRVRLRPIESGGLMATVWLPANLLAPAPTADPADGRGRRMLTVVAGAVAGPNGAHPLAAGRPGGAPGEAASARQRVRRETPTRAEDVLGMSTDGSGPAPGSTWWSRQGRSGSAATPVVEHSPLPTGNAPPAVPVTGGIKPSGLPIRVPMAQLPVKSEPTRPRVPVQREEPDPEQVAGTLSRYYGGVRRAEAEDTIVIPMAPAGARSEEEQY
ncbi:sensor histidine kinase [Plantactinospora soyae]|uniref:histidine kinase n=1 Tax=Plantactinospora soyae TaxID=1544732 RepID=A0A927MCI3_9ACTN|nr:nitrate- and nitrite sensing domain-containing protein [Plantactinospora soyae]MBE1491949.1 signal transduction histidine kinase [Plantactinospora soyae]